MGLKKSPRTAQKPSRWRRIALKPCAALGIPFSVSGTRGPAPSDPGSWGRPFPAWPGSPPTRYGGLNGPGDEEGLFTATGLRGEKADLLVVDECGIEVSRHGGAVFSACRA